jgi:hypothetical protein
MATTEQEQIERLINAAISADVFSESSGGFLTLMGRKSKAIRQDVPAAFEMYTLLQHFWSKLPFRLTPMDETKAPLAMTAGFDHDVSNGRLVALIPIEAGTLPHVSYWLCESIRSGTVTAMGGLLALAFTIENHDGVDHLLPDWFAAFYVDGKADHCVPILALRSVAEDDRFGEWVETALHRMSAFGLPSQDALEAVRTRAANIDTKAPQS